MPTYGYRCPACATEFDVWQKMSDPAGADCPSCGTAAKRQFFPAGIVFKGTGFYATDSRAASKSAASNGAAKGAKPEKPEKKDAAAGDGSSTPKSGDASGTASTTHSPASSPAAEH